MNKKGAEKILSVYWFVILIIVAGGIYGMIYMFYSHPFDIREMESHILVNNIADCISENGKINPSLFNDTGGLDKSFKENFLARCNINFNSEPEWGWDEEEQYFIRVQFFTPQNLNNPFATISEGNVRWKESYYLNKEKGFEILEKGAEKRFYSVDGNKQILIDLLAVVRKTEKNVKQ